LVEPVLVAAGDAAQIFQLGQVVRVAALELSLGGG
jgi:hypothetical protein